MVGNDGRKVFGRVAVVHVADSEAPLVEDVINGRCLGADQNNSNYEQHIQLCTS